MKFGFQLLDSWTQSTVSWPGANQCYTLSLLLLVLWLTVLSEVVTQYGTRSRFWSHNPLTYKQQPLPGAAYRVPSYSRFDEAHILPSYWNSTFCRLLYVAIFTFYKKKVKTWDNATVTVPIYIIRWPTSLKRKKTNILKWTDESKEKFCSFSINKTNTMLRHIAVWKTGNQLYHETDDIQTSSLKIWYPFLLAQTEDKCKDNLLASPVWLLNIA